ncbi:MAG: DUF2344 domain-containing protein [Clostridia bacterium]|nr:DUF2344 domain-containing protein [Clostridia bacterium]
MRCVRVLLAKKGRAKYTSHLDMQRCMMRAVRRAGIELWYTEGFNPHPYVTFALPLPLGVESEGEPVDIRLEGDMTNEQVRDRLNATMPEGITVVSVDDAVHKPADIAFASYCIELYGAPGLAAKISDALACGNLPAEKLGKAGRKKVTKQINVAELMGEYTVEDLGESIVINIILAAGSQKNASPFILLDAISGVIGEKPEYRKITRKAILLANLEKF